MLAPMPVGAVPGARSRVSVRARSLALPLLACAVLVTGLGASAAPREHAPMFLGSMLAAGVLLALAARALGSPGQMGEPSLRWIVGGAALLRIATFMAPVSLSDDVHRYLWDGALLGAGHDPYALRPADAVGLAGLDASDLSRLNSPHYFTIYPPLAQLVFALGAAIPLDEARGLRLLFVLSDLIAIALLARLLDRLERPRIWALAYAWHPLAFWETGAGGHTEALMLPLVLAALDEALDDRPARASVWLGLAASTKLTALVFVPVLAAFAWRRRGPRALASAPLAPLVLIATFLPFYRATLWPNLRASLSLFTADFSFDAPVYYALRHALGYREGLTDPVDGTVMPLMAIATLLCVAGSSALQTGESRRLLAGLLASIVALLLFSRVLHPWYVLPALALGSLLPWRPIVLFALLAPLSYLAYSIGHEPAWLMAAQFAPFLITIALEHRRLARRLA